MKHEIIVTSYKTNLLVKFDENAFTVMMSPEMGLVPVGVDIKTLERFLAIWKRTDDICINTNIRSIDISEIVSNCRKYLAVYNSFNFNLHNVGDLFNYDVTFMVKKNFY